MFGVSENYAALCLIVFIVGSAAGVLVGGFFADRVRHHDRVATLRFAGGRRAHRADRRCRAVTPALLLPLCWRLAGFAGGITNPSRDMIVRNATPPGASGKVFGFVYSGLDVGSFLAPPVFGFADDRRRCRASIFWIAVGPLRRQCGAGAGDPPGAPSRPSSLPRLNDSRGHGALRRLPAPPATRARRGRVSRSSRSFSRCRLGDVDRADRRRSRDRPAWPRCSPRCLLSLAMLFSSVSSVFSSARASSACRRCLRCSPGAGRARATAARARVCVLASPWRSLAGRRCARAAAWPGSRRCRRRTASPLPSATSQSWSATIFTRCVSWLTSTTAPSKSLMRLDQRRARVHVEMVGRLVEQQQVRRVARRQRQQQARLLAARQARRP